MSLCCVMLIHPPTVTANEPLSDGASLADSASPGCEVLRTSDTEGGSNCVVGHETEYSPWSVPSRLS
jgi:hypothetical protein